MVLRSQSRFAAAALCVVSAVAHLLITREHLQEAPYVGVLFVALEVVLAALAVLLVLRDSRAVWLLTGATASATLVAYALSRSVGLPQIGDDVGDWGDPLGLVCLVAELGLAGLAVAALRGRPAERPGPAVRRRPLVAAASVLVVGLVATGGAASATSDAPAGSGHRHATSAPYWTDVAGSGTPRGGVTRTYYVGADVVAWDYAPDGRNDITGQPFDEVADVFVTPGPNRIGSTYDKCLYRGYTDDTFGTLLPRAPSERYLGLLGPVLRAEVGDTIRVVFRNRCGFPASVHPHGVFYGKDSEGAPYDDGSGPADRRDDAVPDQGRHTYTWQVPERAGPGPGDGSSVMWMYHSHTDEVADTNAGLVGPMVITAKGHARADGSPKDVGREVFALFSVLDENASPFLDGNRARAEEVSEDEQAADEEGFEESNLMHSVNGYVYGNMPMLTLERGEQVRWYVMAMGTEVDLHTPHWHGNVVTVMGHRMDAVDLLPASMVVADMVPDDVGTWLFHCHVNDHILAGMTTRYEVRAGD